MNKIRLTESQLHKVISESVKNVLNESSFDEIRNSGWQDRLNQIGQLAREMYALAKEESPNGFGSRELLETARDLMRICKRWGA